MQRKTDRHIWVKQCQTENRPLWWSETGKIHLKSPWMLWCCQHQSSQKYSHSIPACIALRPVLRKSAQQPQWWFFATSCHLAAGLISMKDLETDWISQQYVDPEIHLLLYWGFFFREQVEGSLGFRWWDICNFDRLKNHQQWMLQRWASIDYADDPSPRSFVVTVTSQLFVDKNTGNPWCNFCISEIWDSDLFHSPVWITVMFCKDSPLLTTICCVGLWSFKKPSRSGGMIQVAIIHSGQKLLTLKSFTSFRPVLISFLFPVHQQKIFVRPYLMLLIHFSIKSYISS